MGKDLTPGLMLRNSSSFTITRRPGYLLRVHVCVPKDSEICSSDMTNRNSMCLSVNTLHLSDSPWVWDGSTNHSSYRFLNTSVIIATLMPLPEEATIIHGSSETSKPCLW